MSNNNGSTHRDQHLVTQLSAIAQDGADLARLELQLAKQETLEKLKPVGQGSGMIVAGGLLAVFGSRYLVDAVAHTLASFMPRWLASLLVGGGLTAGGVALARRGSRELQDVDVVPEKTINTLREDTTWLLDQIKARLT